MYAVRKIFWKIKHNLTSSIQKHTHTHSHTKPAGFAVFKNRTAPRLEDP